MKTISQKTQTIVKNAVEIGSTLGIDNMVMDGISLRGENIELSVAIIMSTKDMEFEFDAIGMGRINLLKSRLQMLNNPIISFKLFKMSTDEDLVSSLQLTEGRTTLVFKCADPKMIKAPKAIPDPLHYEMNLNSDDVQLIIKGIGTMALSEVINFTSNDKTVTANISTKEGDTFAHELDGSITALVDNAPVWCKSYKAKTLKTIFSNYIRKDDNNILPISITSRGIMRISVLGMFIYLFPER